jgi:hypothetical protein
MIGNIVVQLTIIFVSQTFGLVWPLYITIAALSLLICFQIFAASVVFAGVEVNETKVERDYGMRILTSFTYLASCVHLYNVGYVIFAAIAASQVVVTILSNIFRAMKE